MPITLNLRRLAGIGVLAGLTSCAASAQSDADLQAARTAYEKGDRSKLAQLAPRLSAHVLAPYVEYWQMKLAIDETPPIAIRAFLDRYPTSPLADRLRIDWLKSLARRGDWNSFAKDYPPPSSSDDIELACYGVHYRWQRDGDEALAAARPLWFSAQSSPDVCDPLFDALQKRGDLTSIDRRARFRLASEANNLRLAQSLGADQPDDERITERELTAIARDPVAALTKGAFAWSTPAGKELALYALERAARNDAGAARSPWVQWRDRLPLADRRYGNARIAYHAARQLNPLANDWFRETGPDAWSAEVQSWRIRAALRVLAWDDVLSAIDAMPDAQRLDSTWRYWRARALAAKGRKDEAEVMFTALAPETSFYGVLATEALGQRYVPPVSNPIVAAPGVLAQFAARPDVKRVVKLVELGMRPESQREWYYIVRGLDDDALLLAADHARRVGIYDRAINAADRTAARHDYTLRYLAPFRTEFETAARTHDVDVALLYGIARQESRFVPGIVSSAGAVGLMQLMPGTAKWVAKQVGRSDYRPASIAETELNTQFGAFYFKYWFERLDRMPALAAAAYNAGPGRAQAWRPLAPLEGAIWVETIPFNETRDYVKKVLTNSILYAHAFNTTPEPLLTRLGFVAPRSSAPASPSTALSY
jgi:soluble lytic murein transglycosylase